MAQKKKICSCGKIVPFVETCSCMKQRSKEKNQRYRQNNLEADKILHTSRWAKKRRQIIARDGGYCQRCMIKFGYIQYETLQVHHIKSRIIYPELAFEDSNLITLCKRCNLFYGKDKPLDFDWKAPEESGFNL